MTFYQLDITFSQLNFENKFLRLSKLFKSLITVAENDNILFRFGMALKLNKCQNSIAFAEWQRGYSLLSFALISCSQI